MQLSGRVPRRDDANVATAGWKPIAGIKQVAFPQLSARNIASREQRYWHCTSERRGVPWFSVGDVVSKFTKQHRRVRSAVRCNQRRKLSQLVPEVSGWRGSH